MIDDYTQVGALFRLMTLARQQILSANIVASMASITRDIQLAQIRHFYRADQRYGLAIAERLGVVICERELRLA